MSALPGSVVAAAPGIVALCAPTVHIPAEELVDIGTTGPTVDRQSWTVGDSRAVDALVEQLRDERDFLREKLDQALAEAAHFRQQAAVERERADVLQWEALGRINALTATIGEAVGSPERDYTDDQDAGAEAAKPAAPGARRDFWERLSRQLRGKPEEER